MKLRPSRNIPHLLPLDTQPTTGTARPARQRRSMLFDDRGGRPGLVGSGAVAIRESRDTLSLTKTLSSIFILRPTTSHLQERPYFGAIARKMHPKNVPVTSCLDNIFRRTSSSRLTSSLWS